MLVYLLKRTYSYDYKLIYLYILVLDNLFVFDSLTHTSHLRTANVEFPQRKLS